MDLFKSINPFCLFVIYYCFLICCDAMRMTRLASDIISPKSRFDVMNIAIKYDFIHHHFSAFDDNLCSFQGFSTQLIFDAWNLKWNDVYFLCLLKIIWGWWNFLMTLKRLLKSRRVELAARVCNSYFVCSLLCTAFDMMWKPVEKVSKKFNLNIACLVCYHNIKHHSMCVRHNAEKICCDVNKQFLNTNIDNLCNNSHYKQHIKAMMTTVGPFSCK